MTVYFFHLRSHDILLEDSEGSELPSLHAALLEVMHARTELAADPEGGVDNLAFEVTDSTGRLLLKVPLGADRHSRPSTLQPKPRMDASRHRRGRPFDRHDGRRNKGNGHAETSSR